MSDFISYNQSLLQYSSATGETTEDPKSESTLIHKEITENQRESNIIDISVPAPNISGQEIQEEGEILPENSKTPTETTGADEAASITSNSYKPKDIPVAAIFNTEGEWEEINIDDLRTSDNAARLREESSRTLKLFLYNLVPMFVSQGVNSLAGIASDIEGGNALSLLNKMGGAITFAQQLAYFTPAEMALYAAASGVTLSIYKEFTIKRYKTDITTGTSVDQFDTNMDANLRFHKNENNILRTIVGGPRAWAGALAEALTKSPGFEQEGTFEQWRQEYEYWSDAIAAIYGGDSSSSGDTYHHMGTKEKDGDKSYDFYRINEYTIDGSLHSIKEGEGLTRELKQALYQNNVDDEYKIWNLNEEGRSFSLNIKALKNDLAINIQKINEENGSENLNSYSTEAPYTKDEFNENMKSTFHKAYDIDNVSGEELKGNTNIDIIQDNIDNNDEQLIIYKTKAPFTKDDFSDSMKSGFHKAYEIEDMYGITGNELKGNTNIDIIQDNIDNNDEAVVSYESKIASLEIKNDFDEELKNALYNDIKINGAKASNIPFTNKAFGNARNENEIDLSKLDNTKLRSIYFRLSERDTILDSISRPEINKLGYIKVLPVAATNVDPFKIPFEFNPNIGEMSYAATYEASFALGRTGDIQTYIRTEGTNVSIETTYFATSAVNENGDVIKPESENRGNDWMELFTLSSIQSIETAYKSLVYPSYDKSADGSKGYFYYKPPALKIIFGNENSSEISGKGPYSNLLTYPFDLNGSTKIYHKTFVAASVAINKNMNEYPLYMDENRNLLDSFGFSVTIQLLEIDPSYINVQPSFLDYHAMAKNIVTDTKLKEHVSG